jgi:hypothetical protein
MTIKDLNALPLGTELWFKQGKTQSMPCYLARHSRDSYGRVMVSNRQQLNRRYESWWFAHPRQLQPGRQA